MRAFIFPGQGSQSVGMGKALADASATQANTARSWLFMSTTHTDSF